MNPGHWVSLGLGLLLGVWAGWVLGERQVCVETCHWLGYGESFVEHERCDCFDLVVTVRHD